MTRKASEIVYRQLGIKPPGRIWICFMKQRMKIVMWIYTHVSPLRRFWD